MNVRLSKWGRWKMEQPPPPPPTLTVESGNRSDIRVPISATVAEMGANIARDIARCS